MKRLGRFFRAGIFWSLALYACAPATPTPAPDISPDDDVIPTSEPASESFQPVNLAGPQIGTTMPWVDGSVLVFVPGGEFVMGGGGSDNPQHTTSVSPIWIYRAKVTNRLYALCMAAGQCDAPLDPNGAAALNNRARKEHPVVGVNWFQAEAYCKWAQARLPTEAEWEKTARGPEGNVFPWGDSAPACDLLNYGGCVGKTSRVEEHPAGLSYYEALDLAGNAFEWTGDWYDPLYYQNTPSQDPPGPDMGEKRSVRGSGFSSPESALPSSSRFSLAPDKFSPDLGFRCVVQDPKPFAPYCVTSQFIGQPVDAPALETPLVAGGPGGGGCAGTVEFPGNTITSFAPYSDMTCEQVTENRIYCAGSPGTGLMTVCGSPNGGDNGSETPNYAPDASCFAGYAAQLNSDQCSFDESSATPPVQCGEDYWCTDPDPNTDLCPAGSYYDTMAESCVSGGEPSNACLPGYAYDASAGCCTSTTNQYPGCDALEFQTSTGCIPDIPKGGEACVEVQSFAGVCEGAGATDGGGESSGDGASACPSGQTQYCYYDTSKLTWVCSCY